jgi:histidinol-phosphatase (PHP family)
MAILFDYHTHNERCGHAAGTLADYIEAAKLLGLTAIGLSDHSPSLYLEGDDPMPGTTMAKS